MSCMSTTCSPLLLWKVSPFIGSESLLSQIAHLFSSQASWNLASCTVLDEVASHQVIWPIKSLPLPLSCFKTYCGCGWISSYRSCLSLNVDEIKSLIALRILSNDLVGFHLRALWQTNLFYLLKIICIAFNYS